MILMKVSHCGFTVSTPTETPLEIRCDWILSSVSNVEKVDSNSLKGAPPPNLSLYKPTSWYVYIPSRASKIP